MFYKHIKEYQDLHFTKLSEYLLNLLYKSPESFYKNIIFH